MKKRRLGKTDLLVSEISLGAAGVGGHNLYLNIDETESVATIIRAIELGVNFVDTSDFFGCGQSERLIGQIAKAVGPGLLIATKGGLRWDLQGRFVSRDNSPAYLREALEASLRRLGRETVDLYFIHSSDGKTPAAEAFGALTRFQEEGKIRWGGLTNFELEQIEDAQMAGPVAAVQAQYNFFDRRPDRNGLLDYCEKHGIGFVPYGCLGYGILTGKYRRDLRLPDQDWRNLLPLFRRRNYVLAVSLAQRMAETAKRRGAPLAHFALRWALRRPATATVLSGAKRPEQIEENIPSDEFEMMPDDFAWIDRMTGFLRFE
jgi:aryl-alcohol dehydrogenase-like predicted oxidoreductase